MNDLSALKLIRCAACNGIKRDDADYCFTCKSKSTTEKTKNSAAQPEVEKSAQERQSRAFDNLVQLAVSEAPWRLLVRSGIRSCEEKEILSAAKTWMDVHDIRPVEFPEKGWLRNIIERTQLDDFRLDSLMRDVIFLDTLLSCNTPVKEWTRLDREQLLSEGFEILSERTDSRDHDSPIASLLEVTKRRFAYQLCLLLDETNRSAEAEPFRLAARTTEVKVPRVEQAQIKDSSGAIYFKPGPDPDNPQRWGLLGSMCAERELYNEALIWYRRRLAYGDDVNDQLRLPHLEHIAKLLVDQQDCAGAEPYLEECLKEYDRPAPNPCGPISIPGSVLYPVSLAEIYSRLAAVKSALGKVEEAVNYYKRAVSLLESEKPDSKNNLGDWERRYVTVLQSYLALLEKEGPTSDQKAIREKLGPYTKRKVIIH